MKRTQFLKRFDAWVKRVCNNNSRDALVGRYAANWAYRVLKEAQIEAEKNREVLVITWAGLEEWNFEHGTEIDYKDLTDEQFREVCEKHGGWKIDSVEKMIEKINEDAPDAPATSAHYIRVVNKVNEKDDEERLYECSFSVYRLGDRNSRPHKIVRYILASNISDAYKKAQNACRTRSVRGAYASDDVVCRHKDIRRIYYDEYPLYEAVESNPSLLIR